MNVPTRLGAFALGLAMTGGAAAGLGALVGPIGEDPAVGEPAMTHDTIAPVPAGSGDLPPGLSASEAGLSMVAADTAFAPGVEEPFSFRIARDDGSAVTGFDARHERQLHLVVVSQDLGQYQHLHPALGADGVWSTGLTLPRAGTYRAYADFAPTGAEALTLAVTLNASGELAPQPLSAVSRQAEVDGYQVALDGDVVAGADSELRFAVTRSGARVEDLEPYLGAFGHLVAIRASDLAYLHVHPTEGSSPAEVAFAVEVPSPGMYRLFLDFQHGGAVRTAAFTIEVPAGAAPAHAADTAGGDDGDH